MIGRPGLPRRVQLVFWAGIRAGVGITQACVVAGITVASGRRWFGQAGGVISNAVQPVTGRYLCFEEREEIAVRRGRGESYREIGVVLGRPASTISREVARNTCGRGYRAGSAQVLANGRARRPKVAKLVACPQLRAHVQERLERRWSPEQIGDTLVREFPDRPEMRVSHETIYQSLYVQARGALRRELVACLRTGRALRKPRRRGEVRQSRIPNKVMIADRPAEVEDRAVIGHWEGDLILGRANGSAIGTLVERATRFCVLLHLPESHDAPSVREAMVAAIVGLPEALRKSVTWDQGTEMAEHEQITAATDMDVYFCDPHSPWQRGTNENTNGLLRQYFPKGTDLSVHPAQYLAEVAASLNSRPRKTLGWDTPAESLEKLLSTSTGATTP
jgi:IS30 family transposase